MRQRPPVDASRAAAVRAWPRPLAGVLALAVSKAADLVTTVVGLQAVDVLREANPVVRAAILTYGVLPALVGFAVLAVVAITALVEGTVAALRATGGARPRTVGIVRLVGYGGPAVVQLAFAVHNLALIARA